MKDTRTGLPLDDGEGFLVPFSRVVLRLARLLSLSRFATRLRPNHRHFFMDAYVTAWSLVLSALLFLYLPSSDLYKGVACAVVGYRLFDLVAYRLYFLLDKSRTQPWSQQLSRRSLVIVGINFYEAVAGFAAIYYWSGAVATTASPITSLPTPLASLYFSAVTMLTVGYGDFVPTTDWSRLIVLLQLATSAVFVLHLLPGIISIFSSSSQPRLKSPGDTDESPPRE